MAKGMLWADWVKQCGGQTYALRPPSVFWSPFPCRGFSATMSTISSKEKPVSHCFSGPCGYGTGTKVGSLFRCFCEIFCFRVCDPSRRASGTLSIQPLGLTGHHKCSSQHNGSTPPSNVLSLVTVWLSAQNQTTKTIKMASSQFCLQMTFHILFSLGKKKKKKKHPTFSFPAVFGFRVGYKKGLNHIY